MKHLIYPLSGGAWVSSVDDKLFALLDQKVDGRHPTARNEDLASLDRDSLQDRGTSSSPIFPIDPPKILKFRTNKNFFNQNQIQYFGKAWDGCFKPFMSEYMNYEEIIFRHNVLIFVCSFLLGLEEEDDVHGAMWSFSKLKYWRKLESKCSLKQIAMAAWPV